MSRIHPRARAFLLGSALALCLSACTSGSHRASGTEASRIEFMTTKTDSVSEAHHGTKSAAP